MGTADKSDVNLNSTKTVRKPVKRYKMVGVHNRKKPVFKRCIGCAKLKVRKQTSYIWKKCDVPLFFVK